MKLLSFLTLAAAAVLTSVSAQASSMAAPEDDAFKSAPTVTLLDSTYVNVKPTGSGTFNITRKFRVQTQAGALANHCVVYDYDPMTAAAKFKSASIRHRDGSVTQVDLSLAKDYVVPHTSIFWGASQIMLEFGQLRPGDVVTYEIEKKGFTYALLADAEESFATSGFSVGPDGLASTASGNMYAASGMTGASMGLAGANTHAAGAESDEERFVPPMRGQFYDIVPFWVDQPTRRKVYCLELPDTCQLQYKLFQYEGKYEEVKDRRNGRQILKIALTNQLPFVKEPNMVDLFDVAPKLMLSTTKNWLEKSRWFNRVNEEFGSFKATPEAKAVVAELLKGKKTDMEKITILTHWAADNIRYIGLPMGKGEGYTLHPLDMDMTDRLGVCKDIAGTLIGLLRIAGFKAYPAMTMAGSRVEKIPADHFNHCVCVVRMKDGSLMPLDPTWVPFCRELWSSAEQQQNYLPGIPEGHDLAETPISAPENHYFRVTAQDTLLANGTLRGTFTLNAEGQSDKSVRRIFTQGWMSQWQQTLEAELLRVSPQAKVYSVDYGKDPKNYMQGPIKMVFTYEIPDYAYGGSEGMAFIPLLTNNLYASVQSFLRVGGNQPEHKYAFKDGCSRQVEFNETIVLPKGLKMQTAPLLSDLTNSAANIKASLQQQDDRIKLNLKAEFNKRVYAAEEWPGFKAVVDAYKQYQGYIFVK